MSRELLPVAILAGGLATRLHPLTRILPKALVDVNGVPFIAHQLRLLQASGIERAVVCAGYLGEMIQAFVGAGTRFGLRVEFSFDGPRLPLLEETFFVLYGDSYLPCDYRAVHTAFEKSGKLALMAVFRNGGRWDRSNVQFVDGCILAYDKQHPTERMHHIDYGLGVFHRSAFEMVPDDQPFDLATLYRDLLTRGHLAAHEVEQRFYEIGSLAGLEETRRYLATQAHMPRSTR
jgi:NDP-sugar pyrophosphorylase family protein